MFAMNTGGTQNSVFVDVVKLVGTPAADYLGQADQSGTGVFGPTDDMDNSGNPTFFPFPSVLFAFNNSNSADTGFEMAIPLERLGLSASSFAGGVPTMRAFAAIVSNTAYFSDVTVPGNVQNGNVGFNPDFNANLRAPNCECPNPGTAIGVGPYNSDPVIVPVELTAFSAMADGRDVLLSWTTASETNNAGFELEMRAPGASEFRTVAFIEGAGTTASAQHYAHRVVGAEPGLHAFRLRQVDFDGSFEYSEMIEVTVELAEAFVLSPVYPNPFNPEASVSFVVRQSRPVEIALYDALGRKLQVLFAGTPEAGQVQRLRIDGASLVSGLYFVRMSGEGISATQKVTLLK
jgi:hypothetical protein